MSWTKFFFCINNFLDIIPPCCLWKHDVWADQFFGLHNGKCSCRDFFSQINAKLNPIWLLLFMGWNKSRHEHFTGGRPKKLIGWNFLFPWVGVSQKLFITILITNFKTTWFFGGFFKKFLQISSLFDYCIMTCLFYNYECAICAMNIVSNFWVLTSWNQLKQIQKNFWKKKVKSCFEYRNWFGCVFCVLEHSN